MNVLSFHPIFEADENRVVAGRDPNENDRAAILRADAVVLPQGCRKDLWEMARDGCSRLFPDYTARFGFPGKSGQVRLFRRCDVLFPATELFNCVRDLRARFPGPGPLPGIGFPAVFKPDWGGEGEGIRLLGGFREMTEHLSAFEVADPHARFLIQQFIPCKSRVLRVVKIGTQTLSYWRVGKDHQNFVTNLAGGGEVDLHFNPKLQRAGRDAVDRFCRRTKIDLAGFDLIFRPGQSEPYFLEINYFFGRKGLGGSEAYYTLLTGEIQKWLQKMEPA